MADSPRKPRLLVVTSTYPRRPGDTEPAFVHQLASRLTDRFDVVVATSRAPGADAAATMDGVLVDRYAYAPASFETLVYGGGLVGNLRAAPWKAFLLPTYVGMWALQLLRLQRDYRFDVVHAHWFIPGALVASLALPGVPLCVTAHGSDVLALKGAMWRRLRAWVADRASAMSVVGKRLQDALLAEGVSSSVVLPMGVDLACTFVAPEREERMPRLVFVGRLVHAKRPEHVLRVFAEVLKVHPSFRLEMVGDGPERRSLESCADMLGISASVTFHGRLSQVDIAAMYRSAAVALLASGDADAPEGLGLVAVEALGCGCPVVSVPNVALQDLLPASAPVHFARDGSVAALADTMLDVLRSGDAPADPVANRWREQLVQQFDWSTVADRYGRLLESLVAGKKG